MGGEWRKTQLGQVLSFSNGRSSPERDDGLPFPVYGSNGVIGYTNEINSDPNTIIIGRVGSYCGSLYFSRQPCWITDNAIRAVTLNDNSPRYLYYLLLALHLNQWRGGSGQPLLNQSTLNVIPVSIPEPKEQQAIACILGALDDKIGLNRRMKKILDEMARAIYKSWFVDFDPTRTKASGQQPSGLKPDLAALFPDTFKDSDLGEIPKGWDVKKLGDILELNYGKALKASNRREGVIPVYGSNGQIGWHNEKLVFGPGIVVGRKGNPGVVTWVSTDFFAIDTTFYVVSKLDSINLYFLFFALQMQSLASLGADSAVPGLNRNIAYMSKQVVPPNQVIEWFETIVNILVVRSHQCNEESLTLAAIRDTLLPKLISGELRVSDAERIAERAI